MDRNGHGTMTVIETTTLLNSFSNQNYEEIVKNVESIESKETELTAYDLHIYAASLFQLQHFSSCINVLRSLEGALASDPSYFSLYGAALRRIGLVNEAKEKFMHAISLTSEKDIYINNNYANLLVDLGETSKAEEILSKIVAENPDYLDARINLKKLLDSRKIDGKKPNTGIIIDPLMAAFDDQQLAKDIKSQRQLKVKNRTKTAEKLISSLQGTTKEKILQEKLELFNRTIKENNFTFSLALVAELKELGLPSDLAYKYFSDCLIGMKKYELAEISLLHSILLAPDDIYKQINLVSLCALRGDIKRAKAIFNTIENKKNLSPGHSKHLKEMLEKRSKELANTEYRFNFSV